MQAAEIFWEEESFCWVDFGGGCQQGVVETEARPLEESGREDILKGFQGVFP